MDLLNPVTISPLNGNTEHFEEESNIM